MTQQIQSKVQGKIDVNELISESSQFHANISQNVVLTTEDKLELCLLKHQETLKAKSDWKTPVSILATLVTVLITAEFKSFLGFSADVWKSVVVLSCFITAYLSIKTLYKFYKVKDSGDLKKVISEIKKSNVT
ncbi:hypothetical protein ABFY48_01715 [Lysinibacillus pakistanensis]|uniref:hypothetical protein n=1 Tax=Lysinibacillus pakistanensis TaxID=759811 RepID=UPI003D2DBF85